MAPEVVLVANTASEVLVERVGTAEMLEVWLMPVLLAVVVSVAGTAEVLDAGAGAGAGAVSLSLSSFSLLSLLTLLSSLSLSSSSSSVSSTFPPLSLSSFNLSFLMASNQH